MYKTLGEFSWSGLFREPTNECPVNPPKTIDPFETSNDSIAQSAAEFHIALENLKSVNY